MNHRALMQFIRQQNRQTRRSLAMMLMRETRGTIWERYEKVAQIMRDHGYSVGVESVKKILRNER